MREILDTSSLYKYTYLLKVTIKEANEMGPHLHPDTTLGHVKLKVSDLERSVAFYEQIIGLRLLNQNANNAELTADGENALLVLEEIPDAAATPPRTTTGLYHFAILMPTRKDLGLSLRNLIENRVRFGQGDHLVSEALYLSDPDGNGIELYADRPRDTWQRNAQGDYVMATDPVDLEGLLKEAGDRPWEGVAPGTIIGHVHLHIGNLQAARTFYCGLLGFDVAGDYDGMRALFVSAGGYHHHIGLNIWAGEGAPQPPQNAPGLSYFTIILPSEAEMQKLMERLERGGITVMQQDEARFVQDPSGISIRLMINNG
jgi:catechol 2,3-dioxygenase